jgi:hypothetical protein
MSRLSNSATQALDSSERNERCGWTASCAPRTCAVIWSSPSRKKPRNQRGHLGYSCYVLISSRRARFVCCCAIHQETASALAGGWSLPCHLVWPHPRLLVRHSTLLLQAASVAFSPPPPSLENLAPTRGRIFCILALKQK